MRTVLGDEYHARAGGGFSHRPWASCQYPLSHIFGMLHGGCQRRLDNTRRGANLLPS